MAVSSSTLIDRDSALFSVGRVKRERTPERTPKNSGWSAILGPLGQSGMESSCAGNQAGTLTCRDAASRLYSQNLREPGGKVHIYGSLLSIFDLAEDAPIKCGNESCIIWAAFASTNFLLGVACHRCWEVQVFE
jgi:hypothetical protein